MEKTITIKINNADTEKELFYKINKLLNDAGFIYGLEVKGSNEIIKNG